MSVGVVCVAYVFAVRLLGCEGDGNASEERCQPSSGSAWPAFPKNGNRAPTAGGGRGRHNLHRV